jgi:aminoacrylate hydrolase
MGRFWCNGFAERGAAAGFQVVLHDHRGTGGSSRCDRDYSIASMGADVLALMDGLGLERASLVGQSTGGAIGQWLALHAPDRIDRLVLSATWPKACAYFQRLFEARREVLDGLGFQAYHRHSQLVLYAPQTIAAEPERMAAELAALPEPHPLDAEILRRRIAAILAHDAEARLGEIRSPTLVVVAEDDAVTPAYHSRALARAIPGAALRILPRGGHFVAKAEPQAYAEAVLPFLTATGDSR